MTTPRTHGHGKSYEPAENDRIRAALRTLLQSKFNGEQASLARALGFSGATVSNFLSGKTGAGVPMARAVARELRISVQELVSGKPQAVPSFRSLPGWAEAEAEAKRIFRNIPAYAWDLAGDLMAVNPPATIDAHTVFAFASAWMLIVKDEIARDESADIDSVLADEDEAEPTRSRSGSATTRRIIRGRPA